MSDTLDSPENLDTLDSPVLSRRQLLQAAGGITFLALVPNGKGAFALPQDAPAPKGKKPKRTPSGPPSDAPPIFTALPYLQPGPTGHALVEGAEAVILAWQTDARPATFEVKVKGDGATEAALAPNRTERFSGDPSDGEGRFNYAVALRGLKLGTRYTYTVSMGGKRIAEGYFTTRKGRGEKTRFVSFGDNSFGEISDRMIAYQAYMARPDFVMNTGDNVYENGLDNEYARYFFPVYNSDTLHPRAGAPLLRSVPFYTVIANHDVHEKGPGGEPVADFTKNPDSLAYFTAMHLPLNGPAPAHVPPAVGDAERLDVFRKSAGDRFPSMANYSFDYGDGHFLCLDANIYVDPTNKALQDWIERDLAGAKDAAWKFVVFHHPAFNVGDDHYAEQHMRVLTPLFEKYGVDVTLHGHEHNYQRTLPFTFVPNGPGAAANLNSKKRLVPGVFTIDRAFDGKTKTRQRGITYITTGGGGKHLYDMSANNDPAAWKHPEDGNVEYIARFVSDRHSLTVFEMDKNSLTLKQIDQWGDEIDHCHWTKG